MRARAKSGIIEMVFLGGLICSKPCCFDRVLCCFRGLTASMNKVMTVSTVCVVNSSCRVQRRVLVRFRRRRDVDCDMTDHSYP